MWHPRPAVSMPEAAVVPDHITQSDRSRHVPGTTSAWPSAGTKWPVGGGFPFPLNQARARRAQSHGVPPRTRPRLTEARQRHAAGAQCSLHPHLCRHSQHNPCRRITLLEECDELLDIHRLLLETLSFTFCEKVCAACRHWSGRTTGHSCRPQHRARCYAAGQRGARIRPVAPGSGLE